MATRIQTTINRQGQTVRYRNMTPKKLECKKLQRIGHHTTDPADYATSEPGYPMPMIPPIGLPAMMVKREDGTHPLSSWMTRQLEVVHEDGQVVGTQTHEIPMPSMSSTVSIDVCRMDRDFPTPSEPNLEGLRITLPIGGQFTESMIQLLRFHQDHRYNDGSIHYPVLSPDLVIAKNFTDHDFGDLIYPVELTIVRDGKNHRFMSAINSDELTGPAREPRFMFIGDFDDQGQLIHHGDDSMCEQANQYFNWYYSRANLRALSRARWALIRWRKYLIRCRREVDRQICLMRTLTIHELNLRLSDQARGVRK